MISFFCLLCGLQLKVKPEFAGRTSKCPTCKQPLIVPALDKIQAEVAAGQIDGTDSSLAKAGVDGGVTLEQMSAAARPGQQPVHELLARRTKKDGRYIIEGEIARGGMGTILRAVDCDIRREVAVKYLLDQTDATKKLRFIEEAQITGQLEHPNIVPIHELGADAQKRLFFAMKMVKGRSLAQVLDDLRQNPKLAEKDFSLGRLLNIFLNICNALDYAHSRGVVHRDLKPANIMIGDFGEVYVMDWGLAKVLKGGGNTVDVTAPSAVAVPPNQHGPAPLAIRCDNNDTSKRSTKVETDRELEADLTQEGAVLGTPVYMPPEQASGNLPAIDQRSDIYSLGAILYEIITLHPPIDKEGGYLAILMRVMQGEIVPPENRSGTRKTPKEMRAVVMKALAKNPQDRYPNVETLRQDIERFLEGRSVSAKDYTKWEMLVKFVKRNKVVSAATAIVVVVLAWSSVVNFLARRDAELANARTKERTENAVPALVEAARLGVQQRNYKNARQQVDLALEYVSDYADARLLKGQLLILDLKFAEADKELAIYLERRPKDADTRRLRELCARPHPEHVSNLLAIAHVFEHQHVPALADGLLTKHGSNSFEARQRLLKIYQDRMEVTWKGLGKKLGLDASGIFAVNLSHSSQVTSLTPLEGIPLTTAVLASCAGVRDLTPLRGMPLTALDLSYCGQVHDLTPLKGMPLNTLTLLGCGPVHDLTPLHGMKLTGLSLGSSQVRDLTPLKDMPLRWLDLTGCGHVRDLMILKDMPHLTSLNLENCFQVKDITPLQGRRLRWLNIRACGQVKDVTPLHGMELTEIVLTPRIISRGMHVLRQMTSLKSIHTGWEATEKYSADEFWKRYDAGEFSK